MNASSKFPSTTGSPLPCPLCGANGNTLVIAEDDIERRFGMPVLPVSDYCQARCRDCGLLYLNAPVDQDYLNGLYANETVEWASELLGGADARMNDDERARFSQVVDLVARHRDLTGVAWLDFGCQTGELGADAIGKHAVVMSGVEISADYARRAAALWGRPPSAVRASLDGHRGDFDVITALETLEHMAEPWRMVAQLRDRLKPGGLLVVSVPSSHYFRLKYHTFKLARRGARRAPGASSALGLCHTHLYNFTPRSLALLLERQRMTVDHVAGIGWLSRFAPAAKLARVIEVLTSGRIAIFPSVVAVAHMPA